MFYPVTFSKIGLVFPNLARKPSQRCEYPYPIAAGKPEKPEQSQKVVQKAKTKSFEGTKNKTIAQKQTVNQTANIKKAKAKHTPATIKAQAGGTGGGKLPPQGKNAGGIGGGKLPPQPPKGSDDDKKKNKREREVSGFTNKLLRKYKQIEPKITNDLLDIARASDGELYGLEFKFKSKESLERKILSDAKEKEISISNASHEISDVLRYTMVFSERNFTENYFKVIDNLKVKGYRVLRVKNTFKQNAVYKGINTLVKNGGEQIFELQYHTQKSIDVKENELHKLYEEQRLLDKLKDKMKYDELEKKMIDICKTVPDPPNVEKIMR